jgi:hypothetical protein
MVSPKPEKQIQLYAKIFFSSVPDSQYIKNVNGIEPGIHGETGTEFILAI